MKISQKRIDEIQSVPSNNKEAVAYTPSHYQGAPAVLISTKHQDGNYAYVLLDSNGVVDAGCSNGFEKLLDEGQIKKIWGESLSNVKSTRIGTNHYLLAIDKTIAYKKQILDDHQPFCPASVNEEECEHIENIVRSSDFNIANDLLSLSALKNIEKEKNLHVEKTAKKIDKAQIVIDMEDEINKTLGYSVLLDKMSILIGSTGTGKTRTVTNFCKRNSIDLFSTTVGQDGNHKKALYGEKDAETNEEGNMEIVRIPGALIQAARNVRDNKKVSLLFVDEAFRSEGMDVFTFLSPSEDKETGELHYEFDGIEKQRFIYVKKDKIESWALLTKDSSYGIDNKTGKLNFTANRNLSQSELVELGNTGNISRINKKDLSQYGYETIANGNIYQERFKLPTKSFFVTFAGNYGTRYEMAQSKLDDAILSRSIICAIDMTKKTPSELINIIENGKKEKYVNVRKISQREKEEIKHSYKQLLNGVLSGIQEENVGLPQKGYNLRNTYDVLSITHIPQSFANVKDFIKELLKEVFIYNYIEHSTGLENIEPNQVQKDFFDQLADKSFKPSKKETLKGANLEEDNDDLEEEWLKELNEDVGPSVTVAPSHRAKVRA